MHRSSPSCCFPINVYPFQSLSRLMRGFIVRSCIRNLLGDRISSMRHSRKPTRPIDRSRKNFSSARRAGWLHFHEFTRDKLKGRARISVEGRFDEFRCRGWKKQGNATRFSLSMVGRDDRKRGGRIYEGGTEGGRMRASTSRRRRMLIREIHQGILVPRF